MNDPRPPVEVEYFECSCFSDEHMLKFHFDPEDTDTDCLITVSTFLRQYRPWYQRLWVAIKYLFGYKCKYGHFDCTLIKKEDLRRLAELIRRAMEAHACIR